MTRKGVDWDDLVAEYRKSGMPQKEFAAKHRIGASALQYHLKKKSAAKKKKAATNGNGKFHLVGEPGKIELEKNGIIIRVPETAPRSVFETAIEVLNAGNN